MDTVTKMLQMSEFDKTSLDRAVLMAKGDLRQEAADELAALRAKNAKLRETMDALKRAFETNVRDCETWVQYRNACDILRIKPNE